jgi:hypothetical protein
MSGLNDPNGIIVLALHSSIIFIYIFKIAIRYFFYYVSQVNAQVLFVYSSLMHPTDFS